MRCSLNMTVLTLFATFFFYSCDSESALINNYSGKATVIETILGLPRPFYDQHTGMKSCVAGGTVKFKFSPGVMPAMRWQSANGMTVVNANGLIQLRPTTEHLMPANLLFSDLVNVNLRLEKTLTVGGDIESHGTIYNARLDLISEGYTQPAEFFTLAKTKLTKPSASDFCLGTEFKDLNVKMVQINLASSKCINFILPETVPAALVNPKYYNFTSPEFEYSRALIIQEAHRYLNNSENLLNRKVQDCLVKDSVVGG